MSAETTEAKFSSDEAWKEQIRAENAELDRRAATGENPAAGTSPQVLPADFSGLVEIFTTQALVGMGLIPHPATGKAEPQLPLARHFIDLLGILESKTAGNLTADEASLLGGSLHYLRVNYVEISGRPAPPK